jgi:hypothetical protein
MASLIAQSWNPLIEWLRGLQPLGDSLGWKPEGVGRALQTLYELPFADGSSIPTLYGTGSGMALVPFAYYAVV